ncbi:hypothetical protein [Rhodococcoides fascians]|uniref:hypothetical protein n=1 Tax=Rhodococcoides fascians TaxID=1828 RepID=UPI00055A493A|nr:MULTISPECIES: hypothetical protein [Rhodococcus]OZF00562.1 hypothetical protein CH301_12845 [Rhodococcus sp. 15-1189-1-1a]OZF14441.1 hypothetical protein CH299_13525 [Rhodococcus sp. 14-2686-1-2]
MPHISYNGERHNVTDAQADGFVEKLKKLKPGDHVLLAVKDEDGDISKLYIPYGAPVTVHSWEFHLPEMPSMPDIPQTTFPRGFPGL